MIKGKQSIAFEVSPYLEESASVVGKKEGEGPLGGMFDMVAEEDLFGENTWEEAESTMQKEACLLALGKAHLVPESIRYLFGGDLLRQGVATSMGVETLQIPMFGLYGACSTSGEALALTWDNVNFQTKTLTIRQNASRVKKRDSADASGSKQIITTPKMT